MFVAQPQQLVPQVRIFREFIFVAAPTILAPASGPTFHDAVDDVLRVAEQEDVAWFLQGFETTNDGQEFHPVICGVLTSAG